MIREIVSNVNQCIIIVKEHNIIDKCIDKLFENDISEVDKCQDRVKFNIKQLIIQDFIRLWIIYLIECYCI